MSNLRMKQIDFDTVHRLASVGSLVEPLRRAFVSHAVSPVRAHYDLGAPPRPPPFRLIPAGQPAAHTGVKTVTVSPDKAGVGRPPGNPPSVRTRRQTGN